MSADKLMAPREGARASIGSAPAGRGRGFASVEMRKILGFAGVVGKARHGREGRNRRTARRARRASSRRSSRRRWTANDRLKIRLTLLQEASAQRAEPGSAPLSLGARATAPSGFPTPTFAATISGRAQPSIAPSFRRAWTPPRHRVGLAHRPRGDVGADRGRGARGAPPLLTRACWTPSSRPCRILTATSVAHAQVAALASARRGGADSLHLLVMDLHKAINRLAADDRGRRSSMARTCTASTTADRARVRAFMSGLNRTAPLAFGHPGLAPPPARAGEAHHPERHRHDRRACARRACRGPRTRRPTYTDVHRIRAQILHVAVRRRGGRLEPAGRESAARPRQGRGLLSVDRRLCGAMRGRSRPLPRPSSARASSSSSTGTRRARRCRPSSPRRPPSQLLPARRSATTAIAPFSSLAARIWSSKPCAASAPATSLMACGSIRRSARASARPSCATCCMSRAKGLRTDAPTGSSATRSRPIFRERLDTAESGLLGVVLRHLGLTRMVAGMIEAAFDLRVWPSLADRQALARARQADRGQGRSADCRRTRNHRAAYATRASC